MSCRAYRLSDEMRCMCGLAWSVADPNPPACAEKARAEHRKMPAPKTPEAREVEQLAAMAKEYERAMYEYRAMPYAARQVKAMRSALKLHKV